MTAQHDDYLLLIKWKWVIIKVFILFLILNRLKRRRMRRGWCCSLRGGRGEREEEERKAGEASTLNITLWKYFLISVWFFCFFIFSTNVSIQFQSYSIHHLLSFQCPCHRSLHVVKEVKCSLE